MQPRSPLVLIPLRVFVRVGLGLLLLVGLCVVMGGLAGPARAATSITVGTCDESHLDDAITEANADDAGDTITFSCSGDIKLTATLGITGSMTLDGSEQMVTLDGNDSVQVLSVSSGVSFTLNTLTITHGSIRGSGGGLFNNGGTVSISNSTFASNSTPPFGSGGGLFNNGGTVSISNSTFASNSARLGGGLFNLSGTVSISNSTFVSNSAGQIGGGLFNGGRMSISNSTFANNSAAQFGSGGAGGGLFNNASGDTVSISNSTFANNSVPANGFGGGLANSTGMVNISNSTFANNSAGSGGGLASAFPSTVSIGGSIVANNTGGNCFRLITSTGYNLESGTDCGLTGTSDLQNTDPKLDPTGLQNNGGPTQTLALEPDSLAVDHIPVGSSCPATDQRGVTRPQGPMCDIGAFEMTADDGLADMIHLVNSFQLSPQGIDTSFDSQLQAVQADLADNDTTQACSDLKAFINHVNAQASKYLTTSQATQLLDEAVAMRTRLGC